MLRITRSSLTFAGALTAALACQAATASAAKVAVADHNLVFTGIGTEANDLRLARHASALIVRDLTATLVPGAGCTRVTAHKATCGGAGIEAFHAGLGRGDDRADVDNRVSLPAIVGRREAGADTLVSVAAHVAFYGGGGRDRLLGGPRADVLQGRRGADFIRGRAGADSIEASTGPDYGCRASPDDVLVGCDENAK